MAELGDNILRGWKEIEAELKMTRKAIVACGYPIRRERRLSGSLGGVYALKDELARFMKRQAPPGHPCNERKSPHIPAYSHIVNQQMTLF